MTPAALHRRSLAGYAAVVLGADAIEQADPDRALVTLSRVTARVILCVDVCAGPALAAWVLRGFDDVVGTEDLAEHLAEAAPEATCPPIEAHLWLPRAAEAGTPAHAAVDAAARLVRLKPKDWAAALGWSRNHLLTTCRDAFGLTPRELLQRRLLAMFAELRRRGEMVHACAAALGYCDGPTLLRALGRAGAAEARIARRVQTATETSSNGHFQAA
jgi:AraC-like DNA-binding protein